MSGQPSRFYGLALGKEKNFEGVTDGLLTESDTTPSVSTKSLFYSNNTTNTTVLNLDDGKEGQIVTLVMIDNSTSVVNSGHLVLCGTDNLKGANSIISLINHDSKWYELSRSRNVNSVVESVGIASTSANHIIDVGGKNFIIAEASGGQPIVIRSTRYQHVGQTLGICAHNSAVIVVGSAGAGSFINSNSAGNIVITSGSTYLFVCGAGQQWKLIHGAPAA